MFLVLKSQKIANYFTSVFGVKNDASVRRRAVGRLLSYWKVMTAYFQPRKFPVHCPWCEYCSGRPDILGARWNHNKLLDGWISPNGWSSRTELNYSTGNIKAN